MVKASLRIAQVDPDQGATFQTISSKQDSICWGTCNARRRIYRKNGSQSRCPSVACNRLARSQRLGVQPVRWLTHWFLRLCERRAYAGYVSFLWAIGLG